MSSLIFITLYLAYKGPNRLYKDELEIVSTVIKKVVRETIRHDRGSVESWKLILSMVSKIPTSSADFTVGYLLVKLENEAMYKMKDTDNHLIHLSNILNIKKELKDSLEIEMHRYPSISRIAIPKSLIRKAIKSILKEYS